MKHGHTVGKTKGNKMRRIYDIDIKLYRLTSQPGIYKNDSPEVIEFLEKRAAFVAAKKEPVSS